MFLGLATACGMGGMSAWACLAGRFVNIPLFDSTVGASKGGAAGFAKGLAAGVVGAVVLPVAGVCVGTVQIVRGVVNQPEAIVQSSKGRVWDEVGAGWPFAWASQPGPSHYGVMGCSMSCLLRGSNPPESASILYTRTHASGWTSQMVPSSPLISPGLPQSAWRACSGGPPAMLITTSSCRWE